MVSASQALEFIADAGVVLASSLDYEQTLRRAGTHERPLTETLSFDDGALRIDTVRHEVAVDGDVCDLTHTEYKLLVALAQHPGRVYSRFELVNRVQGHDFAGYERTVDAHVKNLRRKIEPDAARPRYVQTVHGVGYRLAAIEP